MRDAARILAEQLCFVGVDTRTHWCDLVGEAGLARRRGLAAWLSRLRAELQSGDIDGVILHYSAFAFGPRGLPVYAPSVARRLAATSVPVVGFLHELAYPFGRRGWRGAVHAVSQRLVLVPVVRASDAVVLTTEERAAWLHSRRWLPKRMVSFIPVFSNLPPAPTSARPERNRISVGVFGFAAPGIDLPGAGEALHLLGDAGHHVELVLIGAPGPHSSAAESWRLACSPHVAALRFTGVRSAAEIAAELAAVDVVFFPHSGGVSARKGTLAAALAAARPVVAVEGPEQWPLLVAEEAVTVVSAEPVALATALQSFCTDAAARVEQGGRAERFYRTHMAPGVAAATIVSILGELGVEALAPALAGAA